MINYCSKSKLGQIEKIHDFLIDIGKKIDIKNLDAKNVYSALMMHCKHLASQKWFNILVKIMKKTNELLIYLDGRLNPDFNVVLNIMIKSYRNKIFINQSIFGGNKKIYEKVTSSKTFNFDVENK